MTGRRRWDAVAVLAAMLCIGPEMVAAAHWGLPDDLPWWELAFLLPFSAILLGMPQLAMLGLIRAAQPNWLRLVYLAASAVMLGYFSHRLMTDDLTSSSTAAVGLFLVSFYLALGSTAAGGFLLWFERLLVRNQ